MALTLEQQVKKLLGINAVQNLMSKFQYYYTVGDFDRLKDMFWPGDDTECELPNGRYIGIDQIRELAFGMPPVPPELVERFKADGGKYPGAAPGRLQLHTLTTPVIEVADDAKTAKALWLSPGIETGGHEGDLAGSWAWEKFAVDFICEDDKWYFWHFRQIDIFCCFFYKSWTDDFFAHNLMHVPEEADTVEKLYEFMERQNRSGNPLSRGYFYDQRVAPWLDAVPPEPYASWNE